MIKSITVTNHLGNSVVLSLTDPWETGLIIKSITGLGPPNGIINSTDLAMGDGAVYNSARIDKRNIVFSFQFSEVLEEDGMRVKETIEQVRLNTYKYFPLKKHVTLLFETDSRTASIQGYVEKNESDIFNKEESAQVSIICPDPFFYSGRKPTLLNGIEGMFEFPFSNESLDESLINFGEIIYSEGQKILYDGDAESGTIVTISAYGAASGITIDNVVNGDSIFIDTSKIGSITGGTNNIASGDVVVISSVVGDKYIYLLRGSNTYNILSCVDKNTSWLRFSPGLNEFHYSATTGSANLQIQIDGNTLYSGV